VAVNGVEHRLNSSLSDHALVIASLDLQQAEGASEEREQLVSSPSNS
jgi:hypothetical protein